jgi:hypothetical protein
MFSFVRGVLDVSHSASAPRTFTEEEDRTGAPVTVISYGLWQRRFGRESHTVGRFRRDDERKRSNRALV